MNAKLIVFLLALFIYLDTNFHVLTAQKNTPAEEEKIEKVLAWIGTRRYDMGGDSRMDKLSEFLNNISALQKEIKENPSSATGNRNEIRTILNDVVRNTRYRKLYRDLIKSNTGVDLNFIVYPYVHASDSDSGIAADDSRIAVDWEKINVALQEKNSVLMTQMDEKEKTIKELLQKIKKLENKSDNINSKFSAEKHEFDSLTHQLEEKSEAVDNLNTRLMEKEDEFKKLQVNYDEIKIEFDILNAQLEEQYKIHSKLMDERNSYRNESTVAVETLEAKKDEITQFKSAIIKRISGEMDLLNLDKEHYEFIVTFENIWRKANAKFSLNILLSAIGITAFVTFILAWGFLRRRS